MRKNGCVTVGDTDMYYAAFGRGQRKLVVLPGLSDGLATVKGKAWILAAPYKRFFRDYTVYMFSRKNNMPEGYSIADMADDQVIAMKNIGIDRACVMGVSQGGMIAQYIAVKHPEVTERLILAVTAPYANAVVKDAVSGWIDTVNRGDYESLMVDTAERKYFPLIAKFTKPPTYDRFLKNADAILRFDARNELSKIDCPTLIIAGSNDKTVGNDAPGELKNGIANSELYVYEGLGHGLFEEAKDFYERVLAFCNR